MADAADSKSADSNIVWVQVPPPAPNQYNPNLFPIGDGFGLLLSLTTTKVPTSAAGCGASPPPSREAPEEESSPINAKGMSKPPVKLRVDKSYLIEKERTS